MIKEFDLDAPSLKKWARHSFRNETRSTTALYERMFARFPTRRGIWKLLIEVVPTITRTDVLDLLGALTVQIQGNPERLLELPSSEKPVLALEWLESGIRIIAQTEKWPLESFDEAAAKVKAAKFINKWQWKGRRWNPSKTIFCDVDVEHTPENAKIIASFRRSDGKSVSSELLVETTPDEFAFVPCLGKVKWFDDTHFGLISKDGTKTWTARVQT
jgi:hypothetical protein